VIDIMPVALAVPVAPAVPAPGVAAVAALSAFATSPVDDVAVAESLALPLPFRPLQAAKPTIDAHSAAVAYRCHPFPTILPSSSMIP
jgi:hypothetical protein